MSCEERGDRIGSIGWSKDDKGQWFPMTLRAWATDGSLDEIIPIGLVEDRATLGMKRVFVDFICFAAVPPGPVRQG